MTKTPDMITGTVEMVSVEWIMKNIYRYIDSGTDNVADFFYKTWDKNFLFLLHNISTKGFRVPVCIDTDYYGRGDGLLTFGNGHHRFLAAIFLFLEEIPVYWSSGDFLSLEFSDSEELEPEIGDFEKIPDMLDLR